MYYMHRIGAGLSNLAKTPEVRCFLNGRAMKDVLLNKPIYRHGALRKVAIANMQLYMIYTGPAWVTVLEPSPVSDHLYGLTII